MPSQSLELSVKLIISPLIIMKDKNHSFALFYIYFTQWSSLPVFKKAHEILTK